MRLLDEVGTLVPGENETALGVEGALTGRIVMAACARGLRDRDLGNDSFEPTMSTTARNVGTWRIRGDKTGLHHIVPGR